MTTCDHMLLARVPYSPEPAWFYAECLICGIWKRRKQAWPGVVIIQTSKDGVTWGEPVEIRGEKT